MRIALFITCFNDTMFPGTGRAVVGILERLGHTVVFPEEQTCCGQMHFNTGYRAEAVSLARRFVEVFSGHDVIVCPSASCAAMVRENYPRLVDPSDPLAVTLTGVVGRVRELTELLVDDLGVDDLGARFPHRVALHPTCHSLRLLEVGDRPARLLRQVRDLELVELGRAQECCGFGGTFAVKNADVSSAMLADKLEAISDSGADVVCALDNSCLLHIGGGLSRRRSPVRTLHIAEILASGSG
jgi:L-lactate dehydrogenase complex protein LldE